MRRIVVVVASLAMVASGCSSDDAGTPAAPGSAARSASVEPIPPVDNPRDLTGIPACELMTPQQLSGVGIDQPGEPQTSVVKEVARCVWQDSAHTRRVAISSLIGVDGLSNLYLRRDTFAVFEIKEIAGYPVVETQDIVGGTCDVTLGTAEKQSMRVSFTSLRQGETPSCPEAERIAGIVVGNLPPLK